jgi:hypothetical protein
MAKKPKPAPSPPPRRLPRDTWLDRLAQYNAEVARGIVHTPEWDERMAKYQAEFDANLAQEAQWYAENRAIEARQRINLK